MIQIYAGRIQKDLNTNQEYVDNFYPVVISQLNNKTNTDQISYLNNVYGRSQCNIINDGVSSSYGDVDAIPTNLVEVYRQCYDLTDDITNLTQLKHTKISFFENADITSKLNFEMYILNVENNHVTFLFGDLVRNLVLKGYVENFNFVESGGYEGWSLLINDEYNASTFDELLINSKSKEASFFNNQQYQNYFCTSQFAPLWLYYNRTPYNIITTTWYSSRSNVPYSTAFSKVCSMSNNLTRWGNWYTMLKGTYPYNGQPFSIDLLNETQGISKIELGICYNPHSSELDDGYEFESTNNNNTFTSRGFSYWINGTDLGSLFDMDGPNIQDVYLKVGYIRRELYGWNKQLRYTLYIGQKGIQIYCGDERQDFLYYDMNQEGQGQGLSIFAKNDFVSIPVNFWIDELSEDLDGWSYETNPIFFGMYSYDVPAQYSYVDYTTINPTNQPLPGMVVNYTSNNRNNDYVTSNVTIDYSFYDTFLNGFNSNESGPPLIGGGSLGGGTSGTGGGQGAFNDSSSSIGGIGDLINTNQSSLLNSGGGSLLNGYVLDSTAVASFGRQCWSETWEISKIFGDNTNPLTCLISLKYSPFSLPKGSSTEGNIDICKQQISVLGNVYFLRSEIVYLNFGSLSLEEYYGSYVDYDETRISICLPYVGIQQLDSREIMGGNLQLESYVNIIDNSITYFLTLSKNNVKNLINSWKGQCLYEYPVNNSDMSNKINAIGDAASKTLANFVKGGVTGGLGGAIAEGTTAALLGYGNVLSQKDNYSRYGNFVGNRVSVKKAFLIIERPKQSLPENYAATYGYPSNITSKLKYLKGFTIINDIHLENMGHATRDEIEEIETLFKRGVIF